MNCIVNSYLYIINKYRRQYILLKPVWLIIAKKKNKKK